MHGVMSLGAQVASKDAVTTAVPGPDDRNTAVADFPEMLQDTPLSVELSEIVGGHRLHSPYPPQPPAEMKVTVRVEAILMQIALGSVVGLYATLPDAQVDGSTGVVGAVATRLATTKLTGAPSATATPADGLEPVTVPPPDREASDETNRGERPASLSRLVAASGLEPMTFGMTTMRGMTMGCRGAAELVHAERAIPTHSSGTALRRRVNPSSCRRNPP